jgi:hypothetical protein
MKRQILGIIALVAVAAALASLSRPRAAAEAVATEYATLRWDGRDHTHIIRPNGTVESLGPKFASVRKPEHADDRSYFMNLAMNGLAREGYELVAMTPDDYVFKRAAHP